MWMRPGEAAPDVARVEEGAGLGYDVAVAARERVLPDPAGYA
jgi:hypothetical protein